MNRKLTLPACVVFTLVLSACGGGSGGSADIRTDRFVAYANTLASTAPDDSEPVDVAAVSVTTPDDAEPVAVP